LTINILLCHQDRIDLGEAEKAPPWKKSLSGEGVELVTCLISYLIYYTIIILSKNFYSHQVPHFVGKIYQSNSTMYQKLIMNIHLNYLSK